MREDKDALDVVHDLADELLGDPGRGGLGDPLVELVELLFGLGGVIDAARHRRATHLASNRARTSSTGIARDGSAFNAS